MPQSPDVRQLLALDDSCQQLLYVEGHIEFALFIAAAERYAPFAVVDSTQVRHAWIRWRKATAEEAEPGVSETAAEIEDAPRKGSVAVTICEDWLPLWESQKRHERHRASLTSPVGSAS